MGVLIDSNGQLKLDLIDKIDVDFGIRLRRREIFTEHEIESLAMKAANFLEQDIIQYRKIVKDMAELMGDDGYGLEGHQGLNALFISICTIAIAKDQLKAEINNGLKSLQQ